MTIDRASAVPVPFDSAPGGLVLESRLSSISVENTKLGLVHGIRGRLSLNSGPYPIKLLRECSFSRRIQCIRFAFLRSLESVSYFRFAVA